MKLTKRERRKFRRYLRMLERREDEFRNQRLAERDRLNSPWSYTETVKDAMREHEIALKAAA